MLWPRLSVKFGAGSAGKAMATALKKEGYGRRIARKKPALTSAMRTKTEMGPGSGPVRQGRPEEGSLNGRVVHSRR